MMGKIKQAGMVLGGLLAIAALAASAASAAEFHSEASLTALSGEQSTSFNDEFLTDAGYTSCKQITYKGEWSSSTTTTVALEPSYTDCLSSFSLKSPIDVNGCKFIFHTNVGGTTLSCPAGSVIAITGSGCEITLPGQQGIGGSVIYTNLGTGTGRYLSVHLELTGISYTEHNKGAFPTCADNTVWKTNGSYYGNVTIKGSKAGAQVGIWYS